MSKISLEPNASGSGTFTLAAPSSNTNRTLTLPDESGTVATEENLPAGYTDSDALDLFNATGDAPVFACRAWVNFDGTTSPGTVRGSGNVSSVTRDGTGQYTVNFTTAMPDANYSATTTASNATLDTSRSVGRVHSLTLSSFRLAVRRSDNDNLQNDSLITSQVFR